MVISFEVLFMVRAIYSAGLSIFIHWITSAKRTREVRPSLLVRESSAQLIMYSLDIGFDTLHT